MARKKKVTLRERYNRWLDAHRVVACLLVGLGMAVAAVGVFLFVTFSGFGSSAEFIYNQF